MNKKSASQNVAFVRMRGETVGETVGEDVA